MTAPSRPDAELSGTFHDEDRVSRLDIMAMQCAQAEADRRKFKAQFDAEVAAARRQGQTRIADWAARRLAELIDRLS
jgi:hypothetical protein